MIAFSFENSPIVNQSLLHPHLTLELNYPVVTGMILLIIMAMHEGYTAVANLQSSMYTATLSLTFPSCKTLFTCHTFN